MKIILYTMLLSVFMGNPSLKDSGANVDTENPIFCLLIHTPGENWKKGVPFQEQLGVEEHVKYMRQQLADGFLLMGGPFLDNTGGMMVCRTNDIEKARKVAEADPTVISGLLNVEVKQWMIPMTSVELISKQ